MEGVASNDKGGSSLKLELSDATSNGTESESSCMSPSGGCDGDKWLGTFNKTSSGGMGTMGTISPSDD